MFRYLWWLTRISYKNHAIYGWDVFAMLCMFALRVALIALIYQAIYAADWGIDLGSSSVALVTWGMIFAQVASVSKPRIAEEIDSDIKSWKIAVCLLNPVHYSVYKLFEVMWASLFRIVITVCAWVMIGVLMTHTFVSSWRAFCIWIISLVCAVCVNAFGFMMIGMLGFFTEDSSSFRWIYGKFAMLLGWNILPLPFMPDRLQQIAMLSPFASSWYTTGLIIQSNDLLQSLQFVGLQIVRMIILWCIVLWIYKKWQSSLFVNGG